MGCLVAILFFIFFPIVYMWYQLKRGLNSFDKQTSHRQREGRTANGSDTSSQRDTSRSKSKKKHVFKPEEGEYVEYQEMD